MWIKEVWCSFFFTFSLFTCYVLILYMYLVPCVKKKKNLSLSMNIKWQSHLLLKLPVLSLYFCFALFKKMHCRAHKVIQPLNTFCALCTSTCTMYKTQYACIILLIVHKNEKMLLIKHFLKDKIICLLFNIGAMCTMYMYVTCIQNVQIVWTLIYTQTVC